MHIDVVHANKQLAELLLSSSAVTQIFRLTKPLWVKEIQ